jgi:CBS domain containing-hemolysin-like protein
MTLIFALLLVLLNGFFVSAEFAIVKVRETRIRELAEAGSQTANVALDTIHRLDAYLSATQLGITIASLGLGWIGEPAFAHLIEPALRFLGAQSLAASHAISVTLAFLIITFLHIVFGELAPKSLAIQRPESVTLIVAYPLTRFYRLFYVPIYLLNSAANLALKLFGLHSASDTEMVHSEEELRMILASSGQAGALKKTEIDIIEQVLDFGHKRAEDVMVPRVDMVYLDTEDSLEENIKKARESGHTRYPLCEEDADHVIGQIHIRDLYQLERQTEKDIRSIRRDILKVPESRPIDSILRHMQRNKMHMAVVVDEYGGTAGLITIEDIIEEIVGEIYDEFEQVRQKVQNVGPGKYIVDGRIRVDELPEDLQEKLDAPEGGTVGGIILATLNRPPEVGNSTQSGSCELKVIEISDGRIARILLECTEIETEPDDTTKGES